MINPRWRPSVPATYPPLGVFVGEDFVDVTGEEIVTACEQNFIDFINCAKPSPYPWAPISEEEARARWNLMNVPTMWGRRLSCDGEQVTCDQIGRVLRHHRGSPAEQIDRIQGLLRL